MSTFADRSIVSLRGAREQAGSTQVHQIAETFDKPHRLTRAVLLVVGILDLYRAELARVLRLRCGDTGRLASAQQRLETARLPGSRHD